jgi:arsenic resistance protein ArsH
MNLVGSFRFTRLCPNLLIRGFQTFAPMLNTTNGDLNNTAAERARDEIQVDPAYHGRTFAIPQAEDDPIVRRNYRPFLLDDQISANDWISQLELSTVLKMVETHGLRSHDKRLRVLVLHGSMRSR